MENTIGKCECLNYYHKNLIIRVLNESIENQKDAINKVDAEKDLIIKKGWNPDQMRESSKKFIEAMKKTKKAIEDLPYCPR